MGGYASIQYGRGLTRSVEVWTPSGGVSCSLPDMTTLRSGASVTAAGLVCGGYPQAKVRCFFIFYHKQHLAPQLSPTLMHLFWVKISSHSVVSLQLSSDECGAVWPGMVWADMRMRNAHASPTSKMKVKVLVTHGAMWQTWGRKVDIIRSVQFRANYWCF